MVPTPPGASGEHRCECVGAPPCVCFRRDQLCPGAAEAEAANRTASAPGLAGVHGTSRAAHPTFPTRQASRGDSAWHTQSPRHLAAHLRMARRLSGAPALQRGPRPGQCDLYPALSPAIMQLQTGTLRWRCCARQDLARTEWEVPEGGTEPSPSLPFLQSNLGELDVSPKPCILEWVGVPRPLLPPGLQEA